MRDMVIEEVVYLGKTLPFVDASVQAAHVVQFRKGELLLLSDEEVNDKMDHLQKGEMYALCRREPSGYFLIDKDVVQTPIPTPGSSLYVATNDWIYGGLATIEHVEVKEELPLCNRVFVSFKNLRGTYNYRNLLRKQEEYQSRYEGKIARNDLYA